MNNMPEAGLTACEVIQLRPDTERKFGIFFFRMHNCDFKVCNSCCLKSSIQVRGSNQADHVVQSNSAISAILSLATRGQDCSTYFLSLTAWAGEFCALSSDSQACLPQAVQKYYLPSRIGGALPQPRSQCCSHVREKLLSNHVKI